MTHNNKKGFTLIELIITMAIIAILAAIAIPSIMGFFSTGKEKRNENMARTVFLAAQNALTDMVNRGQLITLIEFDMDAVYDPSNLDNGFALYHEVKKTDKVPDALSAQDIDNVPFIYSGTLTAGDKTNFVYKLLDFYIGEKAILEHNICIEFNAKTGVVKSAFYSEDGVTFDYSGGGSEGDMLTNRRTTDKVGYYGASSTGTVPTPVTRLKIELFDGTSDGGSIPSTLHATAYVPNDDAQYTIVLNGKEADDGTPLDSYIPISDGGKPMALTFKVKGAGAVSKNNIDDALAFPYTDLKQSEHTSGYTTAVFRDTALYDPFTTGKANYVKVTWVIDTFTDANKNYTFPVSKIKKPQLIVADISSSALSATERSDVAHSHFNGQSGSIPKNDMMYYVSNSRHLNNVRYAMDSRFIQQNDITIVDYKGSASVKFNVIGEDKAAAAGDKTPKFTGTYSGAKVVGGKQERYKISNLNLNYSSNIRHLGLFGINEGVIEWLEIESLNLEISGRPNKLLDIGSIAGKNNGLINQVLISSPKIKTNNSNGGGLVGLNDGEAKDSVTKPNGVKQEYGVIRNCAVAGTQSNKATVSVNNDNCGGIAAVNHGLIENSSVSFMEINTTYNNSGGIAGKNEMKAGAADANKYSRTVRSCYVSNITIIAGNIVGGIVGMNDGYVNEVFFNYANTLGDIKIQTKDFICPISAALPTKTNAGAIVGQAGTRSNIRNAVSTALMTGKALSFGGNDVAYQPLVGLTGSQIKPDGFAEDCYYLTGVKYNDNYSINFGTPKTVDELASQEMVDTILNKNGGSFWRTGKGIGNKEVFYPYPVIAEIPGEPIKWPLPDYMSNPFTVSYFEKYSDGQYGRWTPKENELSETKIVVDDGYQFELYTKDTYKISLINKNVTYSCKLMHDGTNWKMEGGTLNPGDIIQRKRIINGVEVTYDAFNLTNMILESGAVNYDVTYTGANMLGIQVHQDGTPDDILADVTTKEPLFIQPLFAKYIKYEASINAAEANAKDDKTIFSVRSPRHLYNINFMNKAYQRFKQELSIDLTTTVINNKYKTMDTIQGNINKTGAVVARDFMGTYDGNGKTIDNMLIDTLIETGLWSGQNMGLFANTTDTSVIKNVTANGAKIKTLNQNAGTIAGTNGGKITNCLIKNSKIFAGANLGTAAGINSGTVEKVTVMGGEIGNVNILDSPAGVKLPSAVGGVAGSNEGMGIISECTAKDIYVTGLSELGGIAGSNGGNAKIITVEVGGNAVIGNRESSLNAAVNVGGIVGKNGGSVDAALIKGTSSQSPYIDGTQCVGGIAGYNSGEIGVNSYSAIYGGVRIGTGGQSKHNIGGIAGYNQDKNSIVQRSAVICVKGNEAKIGTYGSPTAKTTAVGGIVGRSDGGEIRDCFVTSSYIAEPPLISGDEKVGGIVGTADKKTNLHSIYYAAAAPLGYRDDPQNVSYYPIGDTGEIPPGHEKNVMYLTRHTLNDQNIYAENADCSVTSEELSGDGMIGNNGNKNFSTDIWEKLPGQYFYPYPIFKDEAFKTLMRNLNIGSWL